jgi:hypothetical protein
VPFVARLMKIGMADAAKQNFDLNIRRTRTRVAPFE